MRSIAWLAMTILILTAVGMNITSLVGLEQCLKLEFLDLSENQVFDLQPLSNLSQLRTLILKSNRVTDIRPLAGLKELVHLDLDFNFVTDSFLYIFSSP